MVTRLILTIVSLGFVLPSVAQAVYEFPVSTGPQVEKQPAISFDTIVWTDGRGGLSSGFDIWGTRVLSPMQFPISQGPLDQVRPAVHVSQRGALCVWEDYRTQGTAPDIWGSIVPDGFESPFIQSPLPETNPRCWWPKVVWQVAWDALETDIWSFDIERILYEGVCVAPGSQVAPDLFGYRFVWTDDRPDPLGNRWDIWTRDIRLPRAYSLTQSLNVEGHPRVSGEWVVYELQSMLGGEYDIWARRLEPPDAAPIPICTDPGDQRAPAIWGNLIVWEDYGPMDPQGIRGYDLASDKTFRVSQASGLTGTDTEPDVSQNVVVFTRTSDIGTDSDVIGAWLDFSHGTGTVILGNYVGSRQEVPVVLEFWRWGGTAPRELPVCLAHDGSYRATTLLEGWFQVSTKPRHFLRRTLPFSVNLQPQTTVTLNFELVNGDVNNDNWVNLLDLNEVLVQFGRPAPTWADLDGSGLVDLPDLNIVLINFGLAGDPPPM